MTKVWKKGYKPLEDYEPKQRGQVTMAQKTRGTRMLQDGDTTYDECPDCGSLLRVRREKAQRDIRGSGSAYLWCPCGYEIYAGLMGTEEVE